MELRKRKNSSQPTTPKKISRQGSAETLVDTPKKRQKQESVIAELHEKEAQAEVEAHSVKEPAELVVDEAIKQVQELETQRDLESVETANIGNPKVVILDIEGTTTPISFVHDVLFPFILENVEAFLKEHWETEQVKKYVKDLFDLSEKDKKEAVKGLVPAAEDDLDSVVANVKWMMSIDRKIGPLKSLQGYIWKSAYESGKVAGVVYDDVVEALTTWTSNGKLVYIYSSGSVQAQKLLFKYSTHGDLLNYFSGHFDTAIGLKTVPESYTAIAKEISHEPSEILFLSDNIKECVAAKSVGYNVLNVHRPGNAAIEDFQDVRQIKEFSALHDI
ncbi:hypothetical protein HDV01_001261 [Terramyces sp. JEL0728]|nr:hypothetical protein HDV01_001261 [Terramyces sp. JEL0728]